MCGVCERIKETKAGDNPFLVKELETGYVVIGDFQHFKGYTLFLYRITLWNCLIWMRKQEQSIYMK